MLNHIRSNILYCGSEGTVQAFIYFIARVQLLCKFMVDSALWGVLEASGSHDFWSQKSLYGVKLY